MSLDYTKTTDSAVIRERLRTLCLLREMRKSRILDAWTVDSLISNREQEEVLEVEGGGLGKNYNQNHTNESTEKLIVLGQLDVFSWLSSFLNYFIIANQA
jgi:hypothetical protein